MNKAKPARIVSLRLMDRLQGSLAKRLGILPEFTLCRNGSLAAWGWSKSWQTRRSERADGTPIPWFTYPAIRFLEGKDLRSK